MELGESVYPPLVPPEDRWVLPVFVPDELGGKSLARWYPGHVRRVDGGKVEIAHASPSAEPAKRELFSKTFDEEQWRAMVMGRRLVCIGAFFVLAEYEDGNMRAFAWPDRIGAGEATVEETIDRARYLRHWRTPSTRTDAE